MSLLRGLNKLSYVGIPAPPGLPNDYHLDRHPPDYLLQPYRANPVPWLGNLPIPTAKYRTVQVARPNQPAGGYWFGVNPLLPQRGG